MKSSELPQVVENTAPGTSRLRVGRIVDNCFALTKNAVFLQVQQISVRRSGAE